MCRVDGSGHVREAHEDVKVDGAIGVPGLRCSDKLPEHLTPPEHRSEKRRAHARRLFESGGDAASGFVAYIIATAGCHNWERWHADQLCLGPFWMS